MNDKLHIQENFCRVCGYELSFSPWGEDGMSPSYEICPCCGAEFGCDDYTPESTMAYRDKWINSGAEWFDQDMMPDNWCLEKQLHNCERIKTT